MSVKTDPASAEIPSAEVFVPAAILDPDFPGLRAAPGQPAIPGQPDPSGSSVPCAQSVPCDQSVPGDISVASGQPVTPGLPAVSVRPVSPAQGAIAGRPRVRGDLHGWSRAVRGSSLRRGCAPFVRRIRAGGLSLPRAATLPPGVLPCAGGFCGRAHPASDRHHASPARQERRRYDTASGLRAGA